MMAGSIIATIITIHIPRNDAPAPSQLCPGILIHAMDMVQPPAIGMPPDIDPQKSTVTATLAANKSAQPVRNRHSRADAGRRTSTEAGSSALIPVVVAHPGLREFQRFLVAPFRNQIEIVISGIQHVDSARIGRIGVEDCASFVLVKN